MDGVKRMKISEDQIRGFISTRTEKKPIADKLNPQLVTSLVHT